MSSFATKIEDPSNARTLHRRLFAALPWLLLVIALGALAATREVENSGEVDGYPAVAERLVAGELASDGFHPFGVPVAIAGLMAVTGLGAFRAGILLSALAAAALVAAGATLAERLRPGARGPATWLLAVNATVWTQGVTASADMPSAAALLGALALAARPAPTFARLLGVGALLGLCFAMHASLLAAALGVLGVIAWFTGPRRALPPLLIGAAVGFLPQLVPSLLGGESVVGANWLSTYAKVELGFDGERLAELQRSDALPSALEFLRADWRLVLRAGGADLVTATDVVLPNLLLGRPDAVASVGWWLPIGALVGLLAAAQRRGLALALALLALLQTALVCITFHPMGRVLLPTLTLLLVGLAIAFAHARADRPAIAIVFWLALAAMLAFGIERARGFVAAEPRAEVALAQQLPRRVDGPIAVLSTYGRLGRYVDYPCIRLHWTREPNGADREPDWDALRARLERSGASVLLVGHRTRANLFAKLRRDPPPSDFRVLHSDDDVVAFEHVPPAADEAVAATVSPTSAQLGQPIELRLALAAAVDRATLGSVGVALRRPDGTQVLLDIAADAGGGYCRSIVPDQPGVWTVRPVLVHRDGSIARGGDVRFAIED
ncbi:MAG: hypothetical protein KDE27_13900 [Planctomycetes bacterium]|nr:hypothetical protein [Planctomycetota bacterium]